MALYVNQDDENDVVEAIVYRRNRLNKVKKFMGYPSDMSSSEVAEKMKEKGFRQGDYIVKKDKESFNNMSRDEFEDKYERNNLINRIFDSVDKRLEERKNNLTSEKKCLNCGNSYEPETRQQRNNPFCSPDCCKSYSS